MADTLHNKLVAVQGELKAHKSQRNDFGGFNYRSCEDILEALKPLLKKYELRLTISDDIVQIGERVYVKATTQLTDGTEIEGKGMAVVITTAYARESLEKKGMDAAQITGAASSYARKYALNGLFCIDDTADADTKDNNEKKAKPKAETQACIKDINEVKLFCEILDKDYDGCLEYYGVDKEWTAPQAKKAIADLKSAQKSLSKDPDAKA